MLLLEAGGDPHELSGSDSLEPDANRLPMDYDVPAFHAYSSENTALSWDFFVRHYADEEQQRLDAKYRPQLGGVLYPRAGTLGGCSAHNAMIFVYPHNDDWNEIADLTGDPSWRPDRMRRYFERLERCNHRPVRRWLAKFGLNPTRHGWDGWLTTERALPLSLLADAPLRKTIFDAAFEAFKEDGRKLKDIRWFLESGLDANDWRLVRDNSTGIKYLPLTTDNHARGGTRERVLDVARRHPDRLKIMLNTLVTRVIFDENNRALGVEYLQGERLYRAHANPTAEGGLPAAVYASCEVILAGGAFNTPQLLMLSGIGPSAEMERHNIPVRAHLRGVGQNLQDRYEISVVNRMSFKDWAAFKGAAFREGDPQFQDWKNRRRGIYTTNGSLLTLFRRSPVANQLPDLFCMSVLGRFVGYYPSYSRDYSENLNYLTWVVLKAHTRNRTGTVTLRSADPRDKPLIDFNYFGQGGDQDITAVVDGIRFVRRLSQNLKDQGLIAEEELPGKGCETDQQLGDFIRANAWGHHASCTCAIGPEEENGVLDSSFRVHRTKGLRVVDASVFPKIPGFFIASSIYMIGEKAADTILAQNP